jgi:HEAT repeat protein
MAQSKDQWTGESLPLSAFIAALGDMALHLYPRAAVTLVEAGERAHPALIDALHHTNQQVRMSVIQILQQQPTPAVIEGLLDALIHEEYWTRHFAAAALNVINDRSCLPRLRALVQQVHLQERRDMAVILLGWMGDTDALAVLMQLFVTDPVPTIRTSVLSGLSMAYDRSLTNATAIITAFVAAQYELPTILRFLMAYARQGHRKALLQVAPEGDRRIHAIAMLALGLLGDQRVSAPLRALLPQAGAFGDTIRRVLAGLETDSH